MPPNRSLFIVNLLCLLKSMEVNLTNVIWRSEVMAKGSVHLGMFREHLGFNNTTHLHKEKRHQNPSTCSKGIPTCLGEFPVVQQLGLGAFSVGDRVRSLVRELLEILPVFFRAEPWHLNDTSHSEDTNNFVEGREKGNTLGEGGDPPGLLEGRKFTSGEGQRWVEGEGFGLALFFFKKLFKKTNIVNIV